MATERRFAGFSRTARIPRMNEIPEGGMCLSTFVVLSKENDPYSIVMGRINKNAQWDHLGALYPDAIEKVSKGWMLPSSHLILYESPREAAQRVLREQLRIIDQKVDGPITFAEAYGPAKHWDFEFVFQGTRNSIEPNDAWAELRFIDISKIRAEDLVRSQADILMYIEKWKK
jgi:hypothetical protein